MPFYWKKFKNWKEKKKERKLPIRISIAISSNAVTIIQGQVNLEKEKHVLYIFLDLCNLEMSFSDTI